MPPGNPFDVFDGVFGTTPPSERTRPRPEKGLPWRAKQIDGKLYLPIEQVCELLEQNGVLPQVRRGLEKHIKKDT